MSRELKFRAWVYYGEKLDKPDYSRDYGCLDRFFEDHSENDCEQCIEQYTGLKDKNGKEIYEGDIVRVSDGYNYEVRQFRTGAWRIGRDDLCVWADSSEVIGTIHENPELLGGEE